MGDIFTSVISIQPSGSVQPETEHEQKRQGHNNSSGQMKQNTFSNRRKAGVTPGRKTTPG